MELLAMAIDKKQKSLTERDKMKHHRDHELKVLNKQVVKYNLKTDATQTMIENIMNEEAHLSDLQKTIF